MDRIWNDGMSRERIRVQNPPAETPVLLFDGDCGFCRYWVERWRLHTGDQVDYRPYQEARDAFPEIAEESCRGAAQLIETDGRVYSGAAAALRVLSIANKHAWLWRAYNGLPGFAWLSEWGYARVARNRGGLSKLLIRLGAPQSSACSRRSKS